MGEGYQSLLFVLSQQNVDLCGKSKFIIKKNKQSFRREFVKASKDPTESQTLSPTACDRLVRKTQLVETKRSDDIVGWSSNTFSRGRGREKRKLSVWRVVVKSEDIRRNNSDAILYRGRRQSIQHFQAILPGLWSADGPCSYPPFVTSESHYNLDKIKKNYCRWLKRYSYQELWSV